MLQTSFVGKDLGAHLNGDEAMCFGSAFIASNSSESFKVKKIFLTQRIPTALTIRISPLESEAEKSEEVEYSKTAKLFKQGDILGLKKTISLTYDLDMQIELFRGEQTDSDPELENAERLSVYTVKGIENLRNNHIGKKEGSTKPKVSLSFELTRSGIVSL
jgi:molecular chaperone DnaK (HSP70)